MEMARAGKALKGAAKNVEVPSDFDPYSRSHHQFIQNFVHFCINKKKIHLLEKDCFCTYRNPLLPKGKKMMHFSHHPQSSSKLPNDREELKDTKTNFSSSC